MEPIEYVSPEPFKTKEGIYIFPFKPLDDNGCNSLGRITWNLEITRADIQEDGVNRIQEFLIYATQTRDPLYIGKVFKFQCNTTSLDIQAARLGLVRACPIHETPIIPLLPSNEHSRLQIDLRSTVINDIELI